MSGELAGMRYRVESSEWAFDMVKPFGPSILETTLPPDILAGMLALSDQLLSDPNRTSWGKNLVGQIREECLIEQHYFAEFGVARYLREMFAEYVTGSICSNAPPDYRDDVEELRRTGQYRNPVQVKIESAWIVSQRAGEFNPIHGHSGATLSSVMYLKVPQNPDIAPIPDKPSLEGHFEFADRSVGDGLQNATARIKPTVGKFYIFPASLLHLVYPFHSNGEERRSVSINVTHRL